MFVNVSNWHNAKIVLPVGFVSNLKPFTQYLLCNYDFLYKLHPHFVCKVLWLLLKVKRDIENGINEQNQKSNCNCHFLYEWSWRSMFCIVFPLPAIFTMVTKQQTKGEWLNEWTIYASLYFILAVAANMSTVSIINYERKANLFLFS